MSSSALKLAGITIVLAIAVAVVLDMVAPFKGEKVPPVEHVVEAEQVFSKQIPDDLAPDQSSGGSSANEVALADDECAEQAAPEALESEGDAAAEGEPEVPSGVAAQGYPAGAAPAVSEVDQATLVDEASQAELASQGDAQTAAANDTPAADADSALAASSEPSSGEQAAPAPGAVAAQGHPGGAAAPAVESEPAVEATPEPTPEPEAQAQPQPAPAAVSRPVQRKRPAPVRRVAKPNPRPSDDELTAWWPAAEDGSLQLQFAGEASFTQAIALLFDGSFDDVSSINERVVVKTRDGRRVRGQWLLNLQNDKMALFNSGPGTFEVSVSEGIVDRDGRTMSSSASGLVYVK